MKENQLREVLDKCYDTALNGVPAVSSSIEELGQEYLSKNSDVNKAANSFINFQIGKCATSGFITGLGGILILPVAVPANVSSVLYVQLRMIACIAYMGGHDVKSDQVRTMAYVCLTGSAATDILKSTGIKIGEKLTVSMIKKIPGTVLTKINQKVGFRLLTKFGQKGAVNLVKMVPIAGGLIGGGIDASSTKIIANNAVKIFL